MHSYAYPALYCLAVWWFSTGAIVFLNNLPPATFTRSFGAYSLVAGLAFCALVGTSHDASLAGAYTAFTCGVLLWGWHEMAFFMGFLTGPRKTACPPGCHGARHFGHGVQACIDHELAVVGTAAAMVWVGWGASNQIGTWTFMVLWGMRQSAKLNVFLGVRNLGEAFVPPHLRYLMSFMARRRMNWLLPISVGGGAWIIALLARQATTPGIGTVREAGLSFIIAMLALAVLEHVLLVMPLPLTALWGWWLRRTGAPAPVAPVPLADPCCPAVPAAKNFNFGPVRLATDGGAS